MQKNIVLTGYMGCGKTTVGQELSSQTGFRFADTDELIVKQQQCTINELFITQGEEAFRTMETELLKELAKQDQNLILSTGGGIPVRQENRGLLKQLGLVIFLQVSADTVYERLKGDTTRPLLACSDPLAKIHKMLAMRQACYEDACHEIVQVDGKSVEQIAKEIIVLAKKRGIMK